MGTWFDAPKSPKGEEKAPAASAEKVPTSEGHNSVKTTRNCKIFFFNIKYFELAFQRCIKLPKQSSFGPPKWRYKNVSLFCTLNVSCYKTKTIKFASIGGSGGLSCWGTMVHHRLGLMPLTPRHGAWQDPFQKKKIFFFPPCIPTRGPVTGTRVRHRWL